MPGVIQLNDDAHADPHNTHVRKVAKEDERIMLKRASLFMIGALALASSQAFSDSQSGPVGGAGGGEFSTTCESGDYVVGFDIKTKNPVMTAIAPVCGKRAGTYGRPWAGGGKGSLSKERCPGQALVTAMVVAIDKTPLVSGLRFTCWNPITGMVSDKDFGSFDTTINSKRMACNAGEVSNGIFGRAGSAIDAVGLSCIDWQGVN